MAIYRGEGGVTDVEAAPGDTEFAGGIIVEEDIVSKGKITAEEGFYGDGSGLTNLPNDNVWKDNGSSIEFPGNGATTTQIWAENNGKYAKVIQKNDGQSYFKGDGATSLGTDSDLPVNIFVGGTNQLAVGKDSVYSFQPVTAPSFIGDGSLLTGLPPSDDVYTKEESDIITSELQFEINEKADIATTYTKTEVDAQQEAQDEVIDVNTGNISFNTMNIATNKASISTTNAMVASNTAQIATNTSDIATNTEAIAGLSGAIVYKGNINVSATDAPAGAVSGDMYVNDYNALEPDTSYPVTGWGSITSVVYADRVIRTDTDWEILPVSGGGSVPTDVYTKAQIDEQQEIQDTAISGNTSAIGTLSGQVGQNSEDIAELQDSIFFSSAYSADYPSSPNRDPENGNMYLQNFAMFTYSYAAATQIFCSKTDESGNVRQFTAIQAGDSIVLNEVDSPNYGRYELVSVEDVSGSYVVMNVIPKKGQGTVITGVKVAFQAFPKPDSESIWIDVDGNAVYDGKVVVEDTTLTSSRLNVQNGGQTTQIIQQGDGAAFYGTSGNQLDFNLAGTRQARLTDTGLDLTEDLTVNGNVTATKFIGDGSELTNLPSGGGGVPEAPIDGKEYARKDAEWVEVTGGDGVAFRGNLSADQTGLTTKTWTKVNLDTASIDTNNALVDGKFKPSVAGYYQVNGSVTNFGTTADVSFRTIAGLQKNGAFVTSGCNVASSYDAGSKTSITSDVIYLNGTTDYIELYAYLTVDSGTVSVFGSPVSTFLSAVLVTGGTGTGGGSYTPEAMVWSEDLSPSGSSERLPETVYTNTNDVPLYVQIYTTSTDPGGNVLAYIDGEFLGRVGTAGSNSAYDMSLYIVPSGATYEFKIEDGAVIQRWREARMPLAIAVGGGGGGDVQEAVVMKAKLSANQSIPKEVDTKVNLVDTIYDTDSAFADGKFQPKVAGYYQVNGIVGSKSSTPKSLRTIALIYLNGVYETAGTDLAYAVDAGWDGISNVSSIIYLNGTSDYIELYGYVSSTGAVINANTTELSASLITGQSSGGGSGGGTTDILPVLYSGTISIDGSVNKGTGFTCVNTAVGQYDITFDTPRDSVDYAVNTTTITSSARYATVSGYTENGFTVWIRSESGDSDSTIPFNQGFTFTVTGTETIAVGGGSGSYTPEKMVWQDKSAERAVNVEYTNTNDVPLYVQVYANSPVSANLEFLIDGEAFGKVGAGAGGGTNQDIPMIIVPSGSTYELSRSSGSVSVPFWHEARMPVAVGTGGKTVAFRANMTTTGVTLDGGAYKVVPFNTTEFDTENAFDSASHSYVVKESGVYNFTTYAQTSAPGVYHAGLFVNGIATAYGSNVGSPTLGGNDSYILDLKVGDKVDYRVLGDTGIILTISPSTCYFSGFKVSGGSASGDSIWTEEDGVATYDGGVNVGGNIHWGSQGNGRIFSDKNWGCIYTADQVSPAQADFMWQSASGTEHMRLGTDGTVNFANLPTSASVGNVYISGGGFLYKSTATLYSAEEVDKKLVIKDKLIEKLSARLDELEKKVN